MLTFTQAIQEVGKRVPLDHGAPITPVKGSPLPESASRLEAAMTGDPIIDGAMSGPITSNAILNPVIDRTYDTPYGAGGSVPLEDPTVYLDVHTPKTLTVPRLSKPEFTVTFDPAEPYCIHENLEQRVMEWLIAAGWEDEPAYRVAHYCFAEVAEAAWYKAHDIDQSKAEAEEDVWLEQIQHENPERPPPNLYVTPYPHRDVGAAASEPFVEQIPSADDVRRGREVVAAALGIIDPTPDRIKIVKHKEAAMGAQIDPRVKEYLSKNAPDYLELIQAVSRGEFGPYGKTQPGAADVHVPSASGGKRKSFKDIIGDLRKPKAEPEAVTEKADWSMPMDIVKTEEDQQLIFGWASVSEIGGKLVIDKQEDIILPEDLEKAAYSYVKWLQEPDEEKTLKYLEKIGAHELAKALQPTLFAKRADAGLGFMHETKLVESKLIESMVFTKQKQDTLGIDLGLQGWWVGFHCADRALFLKVKDGTYSEFSIGGKAIREKV